MIKSKYNFIVVEDDLQVCEDIKNRMLTFKNWNCLGLIPSFEIAINCIENQKPDLLFLDYSIRGGNTFDLLDTIKTIENYHPFIIYFTGYGSDNQFISEDVVYKYNVNIFLNKSIQEKLTNSLQEYIAKAEIWVEKNATNGIWIETIDREKIKILPQNIFCISQSEINSRFKIIHTTDAKEYEIKASWQDCEAFATKNKIDYCFTNARYTLINKSYISKIQKPFIWLNNNQLKVEVTKDKWRNIE